jgi:L-aspartate oxidase
MTEDDEGGRLQNPRARERKGRDTFERYLAPFELRRTPVLRTDVLVIGAGIAGASAALSAAEAGASVLCLIKGPFSESNTAYARGGVAAVLTEGDSTDLHVQDTLRVGAGLCDPEAVRSIVGGGPDAVAWLESLGARFDLGANGAYELGREGGHSVSRIVHANGDATGREIQRAIAEKLPTHERVDIRADAFVRDLLLDDAGRVVGALARIGDAELAVECGAVVVATGGAGQIYRETTNPAGASGDGMALCFRAGAELTDLEFVQFHPTTLYIAGASRILISEVVRGAGAVLRDREGTRFMESVHPDAELAPRDVVSRAMLERMVATGDTHVYLDMSEVAGDPESLFPGLARVCQAFDIDMRRDLIPVRPGAHYCVGGVHVDASGRTCVPGLFAAGETAASFLHGANRLASNSLLEGVVLGRSAGVSAAQDALQPGLVVALPKRIDVPSPSADGPRLILDDMLYALKSVMWRQVGLKRSAAPLTEARDRIGLWHDYLLRSAHPDQKTCELANMLTVSSVIARAALARTESRGTHFREDWPERRDAEWCRHVFFRRDEDGRVAERSGAVFAASDRETEAAS